MTENVDLAREPCPDRIVEDLGGAFGMGCIGGFLWHFGRGFHNSPRGERLFGGLYSARTRAPILGGNFAVWGGTFSMFDCAFQYMRKRDDQWNAIASGAATGGLLALRGGWRNAGRQAVIGGVLLAVIEGVMVVFSRRTATTPRDQYYEAVKMEQRAAAAAERAKQAAEPVPAPQPVITTPAEPAFELPISPSSTFSTEYAPPCPDAVKRSFWRWL